MSVPTLVVDGKPISQSTAILEYLEEQYPGTELARCQPTCHPKFNFTVTEKPLLPTDRFARAKVRQVRFVFVLSCRVTHPQL
jgi:glutathione S-transferase